MVPINKDPIDFLIENDYGMLLKYKIGQLEAKDPIKSDPRYVHKAISSNAMKCLTALMCGDFCHYGAINLCISRGNGANGLLRLIIEGFAVPITKDTVYYAERHATAEMREIFKDNGIEIPEYKPPAYHFKGFDCNNDERFYRHGGRHHYHNNKHNRRRIWNAKMHQFETDSDDNDTPPPQSAAKTIHDTKYLNFESYARDPNEPQFATNSLFDDITTDIDDMYCDNAGSVESIDDGNCDVAPGNPPNEHYAEMENKSLSASSLKQNNNYTGALMFLWEALADHDHDRVKIYARWASPALYLSAIGSGCILCVRSLDEGGAEMPINAVEYATRTKNISILHYFTQRATVA